MVLAAERNSKASTSANFDRKAYMPAKNFLIQPENAEKMAREHSCAVKGDPKCLACVVEAYSQPGGCPGGGYTARKHAAARGSAMN
jgi:hypothetical protein